MRGCLAAGLTPETLGEPSSSDMHLVSLGVSFQSSNMQSCAKPGNWEHAGCK